jgi:AraC-like DNA-binding protein
MSSRPPLRKIQSGIERINASTCPPRHQHTQAYATVVLEGSYEQMAYAGRLCVQAGDVLVQPTFDCHADRPKTRSITVLRLPWLRDTSLGGIHRSVEIDDVVRAARRDVTEASALLAARVAGREPLEPVIDDWPDLLAAELRKRSAFQIGTWALARGLSREHVSRGFAACYAVAPARFRVELRARRAWIQATASQAPLAAIAHELGFADQAHMSRAVAWLTGAAPIAWRRASHSFKPSAGGASKMVR